MEDRPSVHPPVKLESREPMSTAEQSHMLQLVARQSYCWKDPIKQHAESPRSLRHGLKSSGHVALREAALTSALECLGEKVFHDYETLRNFCRSLHQPGSAAQGPEPGEPEEVKP